MAKAPSSGGRRTERDLKVRVKTSKGRKIGSTLWLQRQLNDPYVVKARVEGLRSRAAYKIIELDDRFKFLRKGMRIVDLGAAPGGWSVVAAQRIGSTSENPLIVGIDYLDMDPILGVVLLKQDFTDNDAPAALIAAMGGKKADLVMSDMAAPTTGHRATDHLRIINLVELAAHFAVDVLAPGGTFIAKVFQGGTEHELLALLKRHFATTQHAKPKASRAESAETYLIARGFHDARAEGE